MDQDKQMQSPIELQAQLESLAAQLAMVAETVGRMENHLEALSDECQRSASAAQRVLLRHTSLAKAVSRIERAIETA